MMSGAVYEVARDGIMSIAHHVTIAADYRTHFLDLACGNG